MSIGSALGRNSRAKAEKHAEQQRLLSDYRGRAEEIVQKHVVRQQNQAATHVESARQLLEQNEPKAAIDRLKTAIQLGKTDVECRFLLAQCYCQGHEDRLERSHSGIAGERRQRPAKSSAGVACEGVHQPWRIARGRVPVSDPCALKLSDALRQASTLVAAQYIEQQSSISAALESVLDDARSIEPANAEHTRALVRAAWEAGDWKAGCTHGAYIRPDESDARSIIAYATCLEKTADFSEESGHVYRHALDGAPELEDVRIRLSQLFLRNEQSEQAIGTLRAGVARDPSSVRLQSHPGDGRTGCRRHGRGTRASANPRVLQRNVDLPIEVGCLQADG